MEWTLWSLDIAPRIPGRDADAAAALRLIQAAFPSPASLGERQAASSEPMALRWRSGLAASRSRRRTDGACALGAHVAAFGRASGGDQRGAGWAGSVRRVW